MRSKKTLKKLEEEWKEMAVHLSKKVPEGYLHDKLYDELTWLKKQFEYCKENGDDRMLSKYFDEVVDSFNEKLHLSAKDRFHRSRLK